jgi:asparagine synthase (glutamine-hydrolysing)
MSAIFGIFYLDSKPISNGQLESMCRILEHRGSDGAGIWSEGSIGLGHRMRHTTPESLSEKLPLTGAGGLMLTADARIDNREELIAQLQFRKEKKDITDSEIILKSYEKWGKECLPRLIGDFVFAIWDPNLQELFCGRDPLGVKHFYYYHKPNKIFAIASEVKALFCLSEVSKILDEESIGDYIFFNFEDKQNSFFKEIRRLPSTSGLVVSKDKFQKWTYWKPDAVKEIRLKNHQEYQEAFREKFTEAVTCRLRSAYPVGSFLSGGLDSSSIVCVASKHLAEQGRPPLHSFSGIFPTIAKRYPSVDETKYMKSVVAKSGCQPHYVNLDDDYPLKDINKLMWHADHPVGAPNMYIEWEIYKEVQKQNVRVLLDGVDGDSTVSYGYEDFGRFLKRGKLIRTLKEASLLKKNIPIPYHNFKQLVLKRGLAESLPFDALYYWHFFRKLGKTQVVPTNDYNEVSWDLVNEDFREKHKLEERFKILDKDLINNNYIVGHWNGLTGGIFAKLLELVELATQSFSIDQRFPFFDRRLIEFCIALPPGERIYNGWTRAIFRYAMSGILPEEVQWRGDKAYLGVGIMLNLLKYGNPEVEDSINDRTGVLENYFNIKRLKNVYQRHIDKPVRNSKDVMVLVAAVYLSKWLQNNEFSLNI